MTRFVVDLGDIALSKETQAAISGDMQKLVLGHLAGMRYDQPFVTKFPRDWWGLVARHDFDMLFDAEKQLNRAFVTARAAL